MGEEENAKTRLVSAETGSQEGNPATEVLIDEDIDPADFIDPDEFGIRRKFASFDP